MRHGVLCRREALSLSIKNIKATGANKFENSGLTASKAEMVNDKIDMSLVNAIAFDPYTHGYYKVTERVGEAFKDGFQFKK